MLNLRHASRHIFSKPGVFQTRCVSNSLDKTLSAPVQAYKSTTHDPYLNLSIEHYLLQNTPASSVVLFQYINDPSVIIGRNQNPWTEVNLHLLSRGLQSLRNHSLDKNGVKDVIHLVRRRSGGGTVFHDRGNVNWTVMCPSETFTRDKHAEMVVRALRRHAGMDRCRVNERHDIIMDIGGSDRTNPERDGETVNDDDMHVTPWTGKEGVKTVKVSGSAFKITKRRALHHGTALLKSENLDVIGKILSAPGKEYITSKGVESVRSRVGNIGIAIDLFMRSVQMEFERSYNGGELLQSLQVGQELLKVDDIMKGYTEIKSSEWLYLQTPRFTISNRLAVSEQDLEMPIVEIDSRHGKIESLRIMNQNGSHIEHLEAYTGLEISNLDTCYNLKSQSIEPQQQQQQQQQLLTWLNQMLPTVK